MLNAILIGIRFVVLVLGGYQQVALENAALRQQLAVFKRNVTRPRLRRRDRIFWIGLRTMWTSWKSALVIVRPETVISWHRKRFKGYWWELSQPKGPGRPRMSAEIRKLIRNMATANPLWGAPRIHGEILKLGFEVSERTVSRLMPKQRKEPSQTWKTFLSNHVGQLVSIDFFTVPTVQLKVLFVFVVLSHERRRVLHFNVTDHPTGEWTAQQIIEAFPENTALCYLIRDRDGIYGSHFRNRVQGMRIDEVLTAPQSPWQNPYVERMIGSIRRECLNHIVVINERHLRWILKDTSVTISILGHTCPWRKTHQTVARFNLGNWEESFRSLKLAASIIATNVAPPDCRCDDTTMVFRRNARVTAGELSSVRLRCNSFANLNAL